MSAGASRGVAGGDRTGPRCRWSSRITLLAVACLALALGLFATAPRPAAAADSALRVDLLTIADVIDPINAQYVARGLDLAARNGATTVLIEMNTPGGLDTAMRQITAAMP